MDLYAQLMSGVLSSILAVLLVELYRLVRQRETQRQLKKILPFKGPTCTILVGEFPRKFDVEVPLLGVFDVLALVKVMDTCRQLRIAPIIEANPGLTSSGSQDLICIGGPLANPATKAFLEAFCPGFVIERRLDSGRAELEYTCGEHTFVNTLADTHAFVTKLASQLTGLPATIILVWGHNSPATAAAAYFIANHIKRLPIRRRDSFFMAIPIKRSLDYRSVPSKYVDISAGAFAPRPEGRATS